MLYEYSRNEAGCSPVCIRNIQYPPAHRVLPFASYPFHMGLKLLEILHSQCCVIVEDQKLVCLPNTDLVRRLTLRSVFSTEERCYDVMRTKICVVDRTLDLLMGLETQGSDAPAVMFTRRVGHVRRNGVARVFVSMFVWRK